MIMIFFLLLSCLSLFAMEKESPLIVLMPGNADGGFNILWDTANFNCLNQKNIKERFYKPINEKKIINFNRRFYNNPDYSLYVNNLPRHNMDLGGPQCVRFYKRMILEAYTEHPTRPLILAGSSQGSVGPLGALAELAQENHPVINNINKVMIEAPLGSTHATINHHVKNIPILCKTLALSNKIPSLLAEYLNLLQGLIPGFACFDAFAPQMITHLRNINNQKNLEHIQYFFLHDINDPIIPIATAEAAIYRFTNGNQDKYESHQLRFKKTAITDDEIKREHDIPENEFAQQCKAIKHLPNWHKKNDILTFIAQPNNITPIKEGPSRVVRATPLTKEIKEIFELESWFTKKTPRQQFAIRRLRDLIVIGIPLSIFYCLRAIKRACI